MSKTITVNTDNFIRAETDSYFSKYVNALGGFGIIAHYRELSPIEEQGVIRMNRDTLYSWGIFDLTTPVTIHKPDPGDGWQSMMVVNQDHYVKLVAHEAGDFVLDQDLIGTRYVDVIFRTLIDESVPGDLKRVNALQDRITVDQAHMGMLELPSWDQESLAAVRKILLDLSEHMGDQSRRFGDRDEIDPVQHLIGTASGWGGNPREAATYFMFYPEQSDGVTRHTVTFSEPPVDGFWSITVYNEDGFIEPNDLGIYVLNDRSAVANEDGTYTVRFGGEPKAENFMPIMPGWNYTVRLYQPRDEILSGEWTMPDPQPAD